MQVILYCSTTKLKKKEAKCTHKGSYPTSRDSNLFGFHLRVSSFSTHFNESGEQRKLSGTPDALHREQLCST